MNSGLQFFFFLVNLFLACAGWVAVMDRLSKWWKTRHKYATFVKDSRLCTSKGQVHAWIEIPWRENDEVTNVRGCLSCGLIPSKEAMVNEKSLVGLDIWHRHKQAISKAGDDFTAIENKVVEEMVQAILAEPTERHVTDLFLRALSTGDRLQAVLEQAKKEFIAKESQK